jgi:hypothetical protein
LVAAGDWIVAVAFEPDCALVGFFGVRLCATFLTTLGVAETFFTGGILGAAVTFFIGIETEELFAILLFYRMCVKIC